MISLTYKCGLCLSHSLKIKVPTSGSVVTTDAVVVAASASDSGEGAHVSWIKAEVAETSSEAGTGLSSNQASSASRSEAAGAVNASPVNQATRLATL